MCLGRCTDCRMWVGQKPAHVWGVRRRAKQATRVRGGSLRVQAGRSPCRGLETVQTQKQWACVHSTGGLRTGSRPAGLCTTSAKKIANLPCVSPEDSAGANSLAGKVSQPQSSPEMRGYPSQLGSHRALEFRHVIVTDFESSSNLCSAPK